MKAIIFDMDGVIVDSEPLHFELEEKLLKELGGYIDRKEHESFVGVTDFKMWATFKEMFNLKPSVEEIIEMKGNRFIENIYKLQLLPNFLNFIHLVHDNGYKIALASSNNKRAVDEVIETFNLGKYFDFIISGEEVQNGKPDPEIFLTVANRLNVKPTECLVIEDAKNGVIAAKSANMKCIGLKGDGSGNQDLTEADLIIENFNELHLENIEELFSL